MSLALRKPTTHSNISPRSRDQAVSAGDQPFYRDDGLLEVAGPIMVLSYALLFTVAAFTFIGGGPALFAIGVSAGFALVFFAVPALFLRTRSARDPRWRRDPVNATSPVVVVRTGPMLRWEAIVQIVSIPIAQLVAFTVLAIWWSLL